MEPVFPDDVKTPRAPDKVTPARKVLENEEIIVVEPETEKIPAADSGEPDLSREQGSTSSTESPVPTAFAGTKVELHTHPRIERDPGKQFQPENSQPGARSADGSGDLLIGQEGRFIGHFRSEKRIRDRKVFEKAAHRLQEALEEFESRFFEDWQSVNLEVDVLPGTLKRSAKAVSTGFDPEDRFIPEGGPGRERVVGALERGAN